MNWKKLVAWAYIGISVITLMIFVIVAFDTSDPSLWDMLFEIISPWSLIGFGILWFSFWWAIADPNCAMNRVINRWLKD